MIKVEIWQTYWNRTYLWWEIKKWKTKIRRYLFCQCKCWRKQYVDLNSLRMWRSTKCKLCAKNWLMWNTSHWWCKTRLYKIRHSMKARCLNKNNTAYKKYWWRWISVCNERLYYENFHNDMYDSYIKHVNDYWERDTTLERIDVNWNYCKNNCRWATIEEQWYNKTNTKKINIWWKDYALAQLAKIFNMPVTTISNRIKKWWDLKDVFKSYKKDEWKHGENGVIQGELIKIIYQK